MARVVQLCPLLLLLLVGCTYSQVQQQITAIFVIRDFKPATNRDFERAIDGLNQGLVMNNLDADRKPVFNRAKLQLPCCPNGVSSSTYECSGTCPTSTSNANGWIGSNPSCSITNQTLFSQWFRDVPGTNIRFDLPFNLTYNSANRRYEYINTAFWPINGLGFGNYYDNKNYHFTVEWHTVFTYQGGEIFDFTGDDDIWVFINNQLAVDLGGVHGATTAPSFKLDQKASAYGLEVGKSYNFDFFFAERHTVASNFKLSTSIYLDPCPFVDACGICVKTQPATFTQTCTKDNCLSGTCSCSTGECRCNPGVTTSGTRAGIFCDQECGNSKIEGSEVCDNGVSTLCCDSQKNGTGTCRFQPAETACAYSGAGNPLCVRPVCAGGSLTCGVNRPSGFEVSPSGQTPPNACQYFGCDGAGGITTFFRADNTPCPPPDACSSAKCVSGQCVPLLNTCPAPTQQCRLAGSCTANTNFVCSYPFAAPGTSCTLATPLGECRTRGCDQSGNCVDTIVTDGTDCGGVVNQGCGQKVCIAGVCTVRATALVGKSCQGTSFTSTACSASICQADGTCATSNVNTGDKCGADGLCNEQRCSNGACVSVAVKEGLACAGVGSINSCQEFTCQRGSCAINNVTKNGNSCGGGVKACTTETCFNGVCQVANTNENQVCGTVGACSSQLCRSGTCSAVNTNEGKACGAGITQCQINVCSSGSCATTNLANQTACGSNFCSVCDGQGSCTDGLRDCSRFGCNAVCPATKTACEPPGGGGACCGNGFKDTLEACDTALDPCCLSDCSGFQNDNFDCSSTYPAADFGCVASATCQSHVCTPVYKSMDSDCSSQKPFNNPCMKPQCTDATGTCAYVGTPDVNCAAGSGLVEDTCNAAQCVGTTSDATCQLVAKNEGSVCTENTNPYETACGSLKCVSQSCQFVADNVSVACSSNNVDPECNTQSCDVSGSGKCLVTKLTGNSCTSLTASDPCNTPQCVNGACALVPTLIGTLCTLPNGDCNSPTCDGAGNCVLTPARAGLNCTAVVTSDCQEPLCASDGTCAVVNKPEDTPCNRTDTPICGRAVCRSGQCANVALVDAETVPCQRPNDDARVCVNYFCNANQECKPINLPANSSCDDGDSCTSDSCDGNGTCVKTPVIFCDKSPLPCFSDEGKCIDGACLYPDLPAFSTCVPSDETRNSSGSCEQFQCISGTCQPNCGQLGICGDGEVQTFSGEECDWAADGADECCDLNCKFRPVGYVCNNTDDYQTVNASALKCLSPQCTGLGACRLLPNLNLTTCVGAGRSRTAIIASLVAGGTTAIICAAAGIFIWRKAQSAAEAAWLKEYLDAGSATVLTSGAFEPSNLDRTNPAFSGN